MGPHAYNTDSIIVSISYSGGDVRLPYTLTNTSDDGNISGTFSDPSAAGFSTFMPILTQPSQVGQPVSVNYLTADFANTIVANGILTLNNGFEIATLSVSVPNPNGMLSFSQPIALYPQQQSYRIVLAVPGLLLTANTSAVGTLSVLVTMMCGCKVTQSTATTTSYWTPSDFIVNAAVTYSNGSTENYTMTFDEASNDSVFTATISTTQGKPTQVIFTATQISTGNNGYATQAF